MPANKTSKSSDITIYIVPTSFSHTSRASCTSYKAAWADVYLDIPEGLDEDYNDLKAEVNLKLWNEFAKSIKKQSTYQTTPFSAGETRSEEDGTGGYCSEQVPDFGAWAKSQARNLSTILPKTIKLGGNLKARIRPMTQEAYQTLPETQALDGPTELYVQSMSTCDRKSTSVVTGNHIVGGIYVWAWEEQWTT